MATSLLRALWIASAVLKATAAVESLQPTQASLGQLDLRADPKPTPRALLAERNAGVAGRSYYNTLCGYVNGNAGTHLHLNIRTALTNLPVEPVSCLGGYICATAANYYAAGCCNPNSLAYCTLPSTCIPYGDVCDEYCLLNNIAYTSW